MSCIHYPQYLDRFAKCSNAWSTTFTNHISFLITLFYFRFTRFFYFFLHVQIGELTFATPCILYIYFFAHCWRRAYLILPFLSIKLWTRQCLSAGSHYAIFPHDNIAFKSYNFSTSKRLAHHDFIEMYIGFCAIQIVCYALLHSWKLLGCWRCHIIPILTEFCLHHFNTDCVFLKVLQSFY